jgi:hypothetical protein
VSVTFTVTTGGGSVTGATAVSDAQGVARVGSWTLGSNAGVNTLMATATNATSVSFSASAVQSSPNITLSLVNPNVSIISDTVIVRANVTSQFQLASVTATLAGQTAPLSLLTAPSTWQTTMVITGAPRDTMTLIVRATDVNGAVEEVVRVLTHDLKPSLVITSPQHLIVARPNVDLNIACQDDDPTGCTLTVYRGGQVLVGPTASPIQQTVSLAAYDGTTVVLSIQARDSRNQLWSETRLVIVETSTSLQLFGTIAGTGVLDVRDTRILSYRTSPDTVAFIQDVQSGSVTTLELSHPPNVGFLTPNGAAISYSASGTPRVDVWRDGIRNTRTVSSPTSSTPSLAARCIG